MLTAYIPAPVRMPPDRLPQGHGVVHLPLPVFVPSPATPSVSPILEDEDGFFWKLVVDVLGNVGAESDVGPATPDLILDDGSGGFWKLVVDTNGLRGAAPHAGPATG